MTKKMLRQAVKYEKDLKYFLICPSGTFFLSYYTYSTPNLYGMWLSEHSKLKEIFKLKL